jgi:hypothetical protein
LQYRHLLSAIQHRIWGKAAWPEVLQRESALPHLESVKNPIARVEA